MAACGEEEPPGPRAARLEVSADGLPAVIAESDHPLPVPLAVHYPEAMPFQVKVREFQPDQLSHPGTGVQAEEQDGPVADPHCGAGVTAGEKPEGIVWGERLDDLDG